MGNGARRSYDEATKAAVMAALLAGQAVNEIAEKYKIPPDTIYSWKSRQNNGENLASLASDKKERIGELILQGLEVQLEAAIKIVNVFTDETWLKKQDASQVAVLYGVLQDKAYRLLEALPDGDNETGD